MAKIMKLKYKIILGFFIVFLLVYVTDIVIIPIVKYWPPERAIRIFKTRHCAEGQIINPLIVCGKKVLPLLTKEIKENKNMHLRGYAILAIGHIGDRSSLVFLHDLLSDKNEHSVFRKDAIRSITLIDKEYAIKIAANYVTKEDGYLSNYCRKLLTGDLLQAYYKKRSYWAALCDMDQ